MTDPGVDRAAQYKLLAEFRYRLQLFIRFSERAARAAGVEPQQHQLLLVLKALADGPSANVSYLSERLQIRHHSAVELVDRLVARGFVTRRPDPTDGRQVFVELTESGDAIIEGLSARMLEELQASAALVRSLRAVTADSRDEAKAVPRRTPRR